MTIELVDGRAGKPHINGDDLGDFKAGILGDEGYVFDRGNTLAATLNDANSVTIDTGSGIMPISGRHFRVTSPENATITSGTQGQNRNDLIVLRPTTATDDTTVESVAVVVLRGTPTDGSAADPETEDTDLVLYRIQLTGVSVADPIALFSVMVPYNKFRDSISPDSHLTSWGSSEVLFEKSDGIVVCSGQVETTISAWTNKLICNIPEGFRPARDRVRGIFANNTANGVMNAYGSDGEYPNQLYAMPFGQAVTGNSIIFNISWVAAM